MAVLGWGRGAQPPPKSCPAPQIFDWFQGCIGGVYAYAVIRRIPTSGVFWTAYNYLICHNKAGYTGIYALTVNKRMCTAPCHTKLLNWLSIFGATQTAQQLNGTMAQRAQRRNANGTMQSFLFFDVRCQPVAYFRDQGVLN